MMLEISEDFGNYDILFNHPQQHFASVINNSNLAT